MNLFREKLSHSQLILFGVTLLFGFALLIGLLQSRSVREMNNTREWLRQIRTIQTALTNLRVSLLEMESNQRGYLLTHNDSYLGPCHTFQAECSSQLDLLRSLTANNPAQQSHFDELEPLLKDKFQFTAQAISLEESGNHAGAVQLINSDDDQQDMVRIMMIVDAMHDVEAQRLTERQDAYHHNFKINTLLSVMSLSLCLGTIILILFIIRYMQRLQADALLTAQTEGFDFEKGTISVGEYMQRRCRELLDNGVTKAEARRLMGLEGD